jgi:membrane dipeptidase
MNSPVNPPILDGHNDTILHLGLTERGNGRSFFVESDQGHIDLPRARRGGLQGGFFAIFVPNDHYDMAANVTHTAAGYAVNMAPAVDPQRARHFTWEALEVLRQLEPDSGGQVRIVYTAADLEACFATDTFAIIPHIEGAAALNPDLSDLPSFYDAGVRSLGLTWSRPNAFGYGVPFRFPHSPDTGPGLTDAGKALVRACNQLGILVDVSHLNEQGFWDVERITDVPLVVTHTAAHAVCASTRNLTDRQLDAVGASDGVVGVNFSIAMTRPDGQREADTPLTVIADHIDYIAQRIGIEHVALGSDFDGTSIPRAMGDVTGLPRLLDVLRARGYDAALEALACQNWLRVLKQTWKEDTNHGMVE